MLLPHSRRRHLKDFLAQLGKGRKGGFTKLFYWKHYIVVFEKCNIKDMNVLKFAIGKSNTQKLVPPSFPPTLSASGTIFLSPPLLPPLSSILRIPFPPFFSKQRFFSLPPFAVRSSASNFLVLCVYGIEGGGGRGF